MTFSKEEFETKLRRFVELSHILADRHLERTPFDVFREEKREFWILNDWLKEHQKEYV